MKNYAEQLQELTSALSYISGLTTCFMGFLNQYAAAFGVIFTALTFLSNIYFHRLRLKQADSKDE